MLDDVQTATMENILTIGINHHNAGQMGRAKQFYQQVLDIDDGNADANNLLARILISEGQAEKALDYVAKALVKADLQASYWATKAEALAMLGRYADAADAYWRAEMFNECDKYLEEALKADPENWRLYLLKGRLLQDVQKPREAETAFRKAQDISPACQHPFPDDAPDKPMFKPLKVNEQLDLPKTQTRTFSYIIDVVGTCNLRCPSCPVGNTPRDQRDIGFMDVKMFEQILAKIKTEGHKELPELWLFNWGEPLLHPEIGKLIRIAKKEGFMVFLSSNLNVDQGLKEVIKEKPDQLKISLSGFNQDVYCRTHSQGHIDRVKGNMYLLKYYIEKFKSPTWVWVSYHMYRHNMADYDLMEKFSQELGFTFNPIIAFYQPIEKLIDLYEGRLGEDEKDVLDLLMIHPLDSKLMKMPHYRESRDCELRYNMVSINFNGMVDLCCSSFNDENTIGVNYLDADFDEIQRLKYEHPFCGTCYKHGLNYQDVPAEANMERNLTGAHMINHAIKFPYPIKK